MKSVLNKFAPFFQNAAVVVLATLFIVSIGYAATTIGSNIVTTGESRLATLEATTTNVGTLTVYTESINNGPSRAAALNATTTNVGALLVYTSTQLTGKATSTVSFWSGTAGNPKKIDQVGGDVFAQDDIEAGDDMFVSGGTFSFSSGTPSTTAGFYIGPYGGTATTALAIGAQSSTSQVNGCIQLMKNGSWYTVSVDESGVALVVALGSCN